MVVFFFLDAIVIIRPEMTEDHEYKSLVDLISFLMEQDAPPNAPFGQYLFGPSQKSKTAQKEPDTRIEREFEQLLSRHYSGGHSFSKGQSKKLADIFLNVVKPEIKKGNYAKYLAPPNTPVYRGIIMSQEEFLQTVNLDKKEFDDPETFGKGWYVARAGVLNTTVRDTMSWTTDHKIATTFATGDLDNMSKKQISVLFVANTGDRRNNFFVNPTTTTQAFEKQGSAPWTGFAYEKEVVSAGPVFFTELSFHANVSKRMETTMGKALKAFAIKSYGSFLLSPRFLGLVQNQLVRYANKEDVEAGVFANVLDKELVNFTKTKLIPHLIKQVGQKMPYITEDLLDAGWIGDTLNYNYNHLNTALDQVKANPKKAKQTATKLSLFLTKKMKSEDMFYYFELGQQNPEQSLPYALGLAKKAPKSLAKALKEDEDEDRSRR